MLPSTLYLVCLIVTFAYADPLPCRQLDGVWRNEYGSNMTLKLLPRNILSGTFSTDVFDFGRSVGNITGTTTSLTEGSLIAFTAIFEGGELIASWAGECIVCDEREVLFTTWILQSYEPKVPIQVQMRWSNINIKRNTFVRVTDVDSKGVGNTDDNGGKTEGDWSGYSGKSQGFRGEWKSNCGDSFQVTDKYDEYVWLGSWTTSENPILFGRVEGNASYTAGGFVGTLSTKARAWAGHVYNPKEANQVLETSWIEHYFSGDCKAPRKRVQFGVDNYTKISDGTN